VTQRLEALQSRLKASIAIDREQLVDKGAMAVESLEQLGHSTGECSTARS
jgi:hypothetical protein